MSTIQEKIKTIQDIFKTIDPSVVLKVEDLSDENVKEFSITGPFPSFMLLVTEEVEVRAVIHVNADATNMVFVFNEFGKELNIEFDGAYAVTAKQELVFGFEAYKEKESNMVAFAAEIKSRNPDIDKKENEIYVPEQKSIYVG